MSAGIAYEGAVQRSGVFPKIFQGKKFWMSTRVPTRGTWADCIKAGGGEVVPLEKNADYLIADHCFARTAPEGSYSWTWIKESVEARRLLDVGGYLVKHKTAPSQPSTTHEGSRSGGRTPFTNEDDKFLIAHVRAAAKKGEPLLGLAMYKGLAQKNPRHTYQSWRERWNKRLQFIPGVLDGASYKASVSQSPESVAHQPEPVSQPPQVTQSRDAKPKTAPNPSRRSAAGESPRPNVAAKPSRPSPAPASTEPGPSATTASPRPSVTPVLSRPKVTPMRPRRSAATEAPRPGVPPSHVRPSATVESQRSSAAPEHANPSTAAEPPRPHGTPEHSKPMNGVEPPKSNAVPTPPQPTVVPGNAQPGVTPQPSRPSVAPGFAWPFSVVPQSTPLNTVGRSPELSSSLKRKSIFSEEEDNLLAEYVQQMWEERGKDADGSLDIFADFELDFPQHSARVWRHRWIRYLRPQFPCPGYQGSEEGPTVTETPQASNVIQQPQVDTAGFSSSIPPTKPNTPETHRQKGKEVIQAPVSSPAHSKSSAPDSRRGQTMDTSRRPTLTSSPGQKQYRDDMSEPSLGADPGYMDEEGELEPVPIGGTCSLSMDQVARQRKTNQAFVEHLGNPPSERQVFARDYESFWYANGDRQERFNSWPTIRGRTFELFKLWKVVTSQHDVPAERDWEVIAEELGFDWVELDGVQYDLANYFEEHLGKFEELMADFDNGAESIEEDDNVATSEPGVQADPSETGMVNGAGPGPSGQPFNSSPPKLPSLKRTQGVASLAYPEVEPKRRKFDRSTEISSTPDHKNGTAHLRKSSVSAAVSPSDRRISTLPRSSRSPKAIRKVMGSPSPHGTRGAVTEPETQDFHYDPETQTVIPYSHPSAAGRSKGQSEADVTASQQLTLESEGFVEVSASARSSKKPRGTAHISPLRRQSVRDPFVESPDDEQPVPAPKPRFGKGRNPLLPAPAPTTTKKRGSLPWTQDGEAVPDSRPEKQPVPGPAKVSGRPKFIRPPRSDEPSSPAAPGARTPGPHADVSDDNAAPIPASCDPLEIKYLRGVLRDWERRGYARDVALRGLDATTWTHDISEDVIELLQDGEPVPDDWFGVWTEADDKRLNIVDNCEVRPPNIDSERLARRRDRALDRLQNKFDADCMKDRRHWLSMKHALKEAKIQL